MEQNAEGVEVGAYVDRVAAEEFRGAVTELAGGARIGEAAQLGCAVGADRDHAGVQIAVNDAHSLRVLEGARDLGQPGENSLSRQVVGLPELRREGFSVGELLDAARGGAVDPEIEDAGDPVVIEPRAGGSPIEEARLRVGSLRRPDVDRRRGAVKGAAAEVGGGSGMGLETVDDREVADLFAHRMIRRS